MTTWDRYLLGLAAVNWLGRVNGVVRRARQPHLRGDGWFFDVEVPDWFAQGAGRQILREYWLRMLAPIGIELAIWIAALALGPGSWLIWIALAMVPAIHLNHWYNVRAAERKARQLSEPEQAKPVAALGLSLTPRRLKDYSNPSMEWGIGIATVAAAVWLWHIYSAEAGRYSAQRVFWYPAVYLYLQIGVLLVKRVIVSWRSPVPLAQTEEYLAARHAMRRYYLWTCDMNRIALTLGILLYAVPLSLSQDHAQRLLSGFNMVWLAVSLVSIVWVEFKRKQLAEMSARVRPVRMPNLTRTRDAARWPVCYQPDLPMLILEGDRGYSLNLSNGSALLGMAYLAGIAGFALLLKMRA